MHNVICLKYLLIVMWMFHLTGSAAQETRTVKHTTSYYAPLSMSLEEAKMAAIEQAKSEALCENFGKIVSSHTFSDAVIQDGKEKDNFQLISNTIAKGLWIKDIEAPKFEDPEIVESQNIMTITVTVHGKIREIVSAPVDLKVLLLRNATDLRNEESNYREGDDMYIYFSSPISGHLVVYVAGVDNRVQTLLPLDESKGSIPIQANKEYMFFSKEDEFTDNFAGLTLTCEGSVEYNRFYFIFSPNAISKARDNTGNRTLSSGLIAPRELSEKDFRKWLTNNMDHDTRLNVVVKDIRIVDKDTPRGL